MYGYYEGLREMTQHPRFFTDAMREELSLLRQQLEDGTDDDNFPWERHDDLLLRQRLSSLPEHFQSLALERLRELVKLKRENYTEIARALTIPVTPANASRLANRLEALKQTRDRLDNALKTHRQLEELEKELFVPELASPPPASTPEPVSDWTGLLCRPDIFGVHELIAAFISVGLLHEDEKPTEWGMKNKGAWAGAIDALTEPPALLSVNADAVRRCLRKWGIVIKSSNTLRDNTSLEAENTRKAMKRAVSGVFR
jgi:hypothetical protein